MFQKRRTSRPASFLSLSAVGSIISLRQFTNNAFNRRHGIQGEERFGPGVDDDGNGFADELTRADVIAVTVFQLGCRFKARSYQTMTRFSAPCATASAILVKSAVRAVTFPSFRSITRAGFTANPIPIPPLELAGSGSYPLGRFDRDELPGPRLKPDANGVVSVSAFTDLKLHDICTGPKDPNGEALNQNVAFTSPEFAIGNRFFLTRKLWGFANSGPFLHHGKFTTIREAVGAHAGEALASRQAFDALSEYDRDSIIEFLKTLKILPPGTRRLVVQQPIEDDK